MMFTLGKESKNPNTEENLNYDWASQITTHRSSDCYVLRDFMTYT